MPAAKEYNDADLAFAAAIVPHWQAGIEIARAAVTSGVNPDILGMAGEIIAESVECLDDMEDWLGENGLMAAPPIETADQPDMRATRERQLAARLVANEI